MSFSLTPQQQAAVSLPPEVVVSAAAGSGKTEVLVRRVLEAALQGVPLDRMLVVTFTRSAAAELRERIRKGLTALLHASAATTSIEILRAQLAALERAQIGTVHSFCLDLVQRYGYRAGLSAERILPDDEARLLRHELAGELLRQRLDGAEDDLRSAALAWGGSDGVGADDLAATRNYSGLRSLLLRLHDFRRSLPDPRGWYVRHVDLPPLDEQVCERADPRVNEVLTRFQSQCATLIATEEELLDELRANAPDSKLASLIERRLPVLRRMAAAGEWDGIRAGICELFAPVQHDLYKDSNLLRKHTDRIQGGELKARAAAACEGIQGLAEGWRGTFASPWPEVAARENETQRRLVAIWKLAEEFDALYSERKREQGVADYADLEAGALRLLAEHAADGAPVRLADGAFAPSGVAAEVRAQLALVFVDEYQDTSPIQDAIIELVTPAGGTDTHVCKAVSADKSACPSKMRFIVGDLKQSIYAFRLAEPSLFSAHQSRLSNGSGGGNAVRLTGSFRSRERLIAAINHIFHGLMDGELGGEDYADNALTPALDYRELCGEGFSADPPARLHLVEVDKGQLAAAEATGDEDEASGEPDDLPQSFNPHYARVAAILAEVHASGQPLYDKALRAVRPAKWGDMAVLLRASRGRVEPLRRELDRAGIPSYAPGRSGFYERPEVSDALSLLAVVDNPRQDVPLAAVLTGPAAGLSPADLARIVIGSSATLADDITPGYGNADFYAKVERYAQHGADPLLRTTLLDFLERLEAWREAARCEPLAQLLQRLYRESGLLAAAAALRNGSQRLANLEALAERARQFGTLHSGAGAFLEYIRASQRAAGDSGEAPLLSEQQDVVRVLTVHQAKGLEFPVVVVPDLQRRFNLPELGDDVQWHFHAGIGGRHVDLAEFRRYDTLGRRSVREARRLAAVSEELRILYVALTRARERLELVASVERSSDLTRLARPRGADATCWLQWVAAQLGEAMSCVSTGAAASCGADNCWEVQVHAEDALVQGHDVEQSNGAASELQQILARLQAPYPHPGSALLPAKVAVTRLAESALDLDTERAVPLGEARDELADVNPSFAAALTPSPGEIGTAVHKLLAELDPREFARYAAGRELQRKLHSLVSRGLLSRQHAGSISLQQVSRCAAELGEALPRLLRAPYQHFVELPVSLLVPALEVAALLAVDPASAGAELVHVQGAIDLLLDDGHTVLVLDYKTGYTADAAALHRLHEQQLLWYCRAAGLLLPGRRVQWALYGLGGAGLVGPFDYKT